MSEVKQETKDTKDTRSRSKSQSVVSIPLADLSSRRGSTGSMLHHGLQLSLFQRTAAELEKKQLECEKLVRECGIESKTKVDKSSLDALGQSLQKKASQSEEDKVAKDRALTEYKTSGFEQQIAQSQQALSEAKQALLRAEQEQAELNRQLNFLSFQENLFQKFPAEIKDEKDQDQKHAVVQIVGDLEGVGKILLERLEGLLRELKVNDDFLREVKTDRDRETEADKYSRVLQSFNRVLHEKLRAQYSSVQSLYSIHESVYTYDENLGRIGEEAGFLMTWLHRADSAAKAHVEIVAHNGVCESCGSLLGSMPKIVSDEKKSDVDLNRDSVPSGTSDEEFDVRLSEENWAFLQKRKFSRAEEVSSSTLAEHKSFASVEYLVNPDKMSKVESFWQKIQNFFAFFSPLSERGEQVRLRFFAKCGSSKAKAELRDRFQKFQDSVVEVQQTAQRKIKEKSDSIQAIEPRAGFAPESAALPIKKNRVTQQLKSSEREAAALRAKIETELPQRIQRLQEGLEREQTELEKLRSDAKAAAEKLTQDQAALAGFGRARAGFEGACAKCQGLRSFAATISERLRLALISAQRGPSRYALEVVLPKGWYPKKEHLSGMGFRRTVVYFDNRKKKWCFHYKNDQGELSSGEFNDQKTVDAAVRSYQKVSSNPQDSLTRGEIELQCALSKDAAFAGVAVQCPFEDLMSGIRTSISDVLTDDALRSPTIVYLQGIEGAGRQDSISAMQKAQELCALFDQRLVLTAESALQLLALPFGGYCKKDDNSGLKKLKARKAKSKEIMAFVVRHLSDAELSKLQVEYPLWVSSCAAGFGATVSGKPDHVFAPYILDGVHSNWFRGDPLSTGTVEANRKMIQEEIDKREALRLARDKQQRKAAAKRPKTPVSATFRAGACRQEGARQLTDHPSRLSQEQTV